MVKNNGTPIIKRPAIWASTAFIIGILLGVMAAKDNYTAGVISVAVVCALSGAVFIIKKCGYMAAVCAVSIIAAFFYSFNCYSVRYEVEDISNTESLVAGTVLDVSAFGEESVRYSLDNVTVDGKEIHGDLLVTVTGGRLNIGDDVTFVAKVQKPRTATNHGVFDYREYLANEGIYYVSYIEYGDILEIGRASHGIRDLFYGINSAKHKLAGLYTEYLTDEASGIVSAVTMGDSIYIADEHYELYRRTGTAHVLAISGLHVGFAVIFASLVTRRMRKYSLPYTLINLGIVWAYVFISGMSISAVRAGIFFTLHSIGGAAKQRCDTVNFAFITALIMLIADPLSLFSVGFQLSFAAVLGIGLLSGEVSSLLERWLPFVSKNIISTVSITLSASIGVLMPIAYHFNSVSVISILLNLVIVPLFSYVVMFAFVLLASVGLNIGFVASAAAAVVNGLVFISDSMLKVASEWEYAYFTVPRPHVGIIAVFAVLVVILSVEKPVWIRRGRSAYTCCALIVIMLMLPYSGIGGIYRLSFIDVGQAECALLVTPTNKTVMVDAGRSYGNDKGAQYTIAPYVLNNGNGVIDYLVLSHGDSDHIGEVESLAGLMKIRNIVYFCPENDDAMDDIIALAESCGIRLINMYYNDTVIIDGDTVINRLSEHFDRDVTNDQSLVMEIKCSGRSLVFGGDMSGEVLDGLDYPDDIFVYKVAHHGSKDAYSREIMQRIPRYSVICTKKGNVYRLPHKETLEKYREFSRVLLTEDMGEIRFYFTDKWEKVWGFAE